jgi:hypothetical protein
MAREIDPKAVEESLPGLEKKLRDLRGSLSPEQQTVLDEIVVAAADHLATLRSDNQLDQITYAKPISAHATLGVRKFFLELPARLGSTNDRAAKHGR